MIKRSAYISLFEQAQELNSTTQIPVKNIHFYVIHFLEMALVVTEFFRIVLKSSLLHVHRQIENSGSLVHSGTILMIFSISKLFISLQVS